MATKPTETNDSSMRGYPIGESNNVKQMAAIQITGDVIPPGWRDIITRENKKPHDPAINILADIVYWHRPIPVTNDAGVVIEYRKRFKGDWLQRDYKQFQAKFRYSRNQVKDAVDTLVALGIIQTEFRHPVVNGNKLGNVLYINLSIPRLINITFPPEIAEQFTPLLTLNSIAPPNFKVKTLTKNTEDSTKSLKTLPKVSGKLSVDPDKQDEKSLEEKQPNPDSKREKLRLLEIWFAEGFTLDLPERETEPQKRGASTLWWIPLRTMLQKTDYNLELTKKIILESKAYLQNINPDIVFSAPKTCLNTFIGLVAKNKKAGQERINAKLATPPKDLPQDLVTIWPKLPQEAREYIVRNPGNLDKARQRLIDLNFLSPQ